MENKVMVAVISLTGVIGMPLFLTYVKSVSDYIDMFISNKINQIKALRITGKRCCYIQHFLWLLL